MSVFLATLISWYMAIVNSESQYRTNLHITLCVLWTNFILARKLCRFATNVGQLNIYHYFIKKKNYKCELIQWYLLILEGSVSLLLVVNIFPNFKYCGCQLSNANWVHISMLINSTPSLTRQYIASFCSESLFFRQPRPHDLTRKS